METRRLDGAVYCQRLKPTEVNYDKNLRDENLNFAMLFLLQEK